jgi:hypothetical protein
MPIYPVACANCGEQETFKTMSEARKSDLLECPVCAVPRPRRIVLFQHTEDRTHLWRGPLGNRYSFALGGEMPDSRSERDRIARAKGIEFCGTREFLDSNKEAAEAVAYSKEVQTGGPREPWEPADTTSAFKSGTPEWAKPLLGQT